MNRMYMLLTINNHDGKTIAVNFKGVICYNTDNDIDVKLPKPSRLCQLFLNAKAKATNILSPIEVILDCETICGKQKVKVRFIKNPKPQISDDDRESFDISSDKFFGWLSSSLTF